MTSERCPLPSSRPNWGIPPRLRGASSDLSCVGKSFNGTEVFGRGSRPADGARSLHFGRDARQGAMAGLLAAKRMWLPGRSMGTHAPMAAPWAAVMPEVVPLIVHASIFVLQLCQADSGESPPIDVGAKKCHQDAAIVDSQPFLVPAASGQGSALAPRRQQKSVVGRLHRTVR